MKQKERKNILLITSDQQHWFTLGVQNQEIKTPNLDRLAKEGMLFERAYCPNPTCTPTRSSIITGKYPSQHGGWTLGTKLPENEHTIGEDFKAAGYKTALVGKAHFQQLLTTEEYPSLESNPLQQDLDFWRNFNKPFYGFDDVELARNHTDERHVGQHYAIWMEEKGFKDWRKCFQKPGGTSDGQHHAWNIPEEYHYDTWIAERTNAKLEEYYKSGDNFFLWSSFLDPHPPYLVCEPWDTMYDQEKITLPEGKAGEHDNNPPHFQLTQTDKPDYSEWQEEDGNSMHGFTSHLHKKEKLVKDIAVYYGMISLMDKYIGKILDKLDELSLTDKTLVVFTTDHGHFYGHHNLIAKGAFHYEDMIKVPMLARLPGSIPAGKTCSAFQSLVDLAPTFLSITEQGIPRSMTGVDQKMVWYGNKNEARDHITVEMHHQPTTIHLKTWVGRAGIRGDESMTKQSGSKFDNDKNIYKISVYCNRSYGEIFNLTEDPGEFDNLWDNPDYRELKLHLHQKLLHAEMAKEPMWMPRVSGA
jgi:uncharacterized sulfatase